jgi:DNA ligase D-like protein (predicted 3'-phosphoesterase)
MKLFNQLNLYLFLLLLPGCFEHYSNKAQDVSHMNSLKTYQKKRSFKKTPEPKGSLKKSKSKQPIFVIQKHDASHLHYDVRFEIDGVLTSWAVPKGPPKKVGEKRLAIQTEDHPMAYAQFAGEIPKGNYGAGTVEIWDHGTYENIKESQSMAESLEKGLIEVYLHGERLDAPYALIKTKFGNGKNSWLMTRMRKKR